MYKRLFGIRKAHKSLFWRRKALAKIGKLI